jgi:hypothetical protein
MKECQLEVNLKHNESLNFNIFVPIVKSLWTDLEAYRESKF